LYFAAYRGRVFVYVPRSVPKQTIPRHPDLQLLTSPSRVAYLIGGYLDPTSPHSINHLIVASLGQEEIVLTCYDDGDVIAFYTKDIAECILTKPDTPTPAIPRQRRASTWSFDTGNAPRPFFHENVGISAWGLAVHQKSRLIAVSSKSPSLHRLWPHMSRRRVETVIAMLAAMVWNRMCAAVLVIGE
jgi:hypothetical protein